MSESYHPRLVVDLTEEQFFRKQQLLNVTQGMQKTVFSIILDDLLDMVEEHGAGVLGVIINRAIKPRKVIPCMAQALPKEVKKSGHKRSSKKVDNRDDSGGTSRAD